MTRIERRLPILLKLGALTTALLWVNVSGRDPGMGVVILSLAAALVGMGRQRVPRSPVVLVVSLVVPLGLALAFVAIRGRSFLPATVAVSAGLSVLAMLAWACANPAARHAVVGFLGRRHAETPASQIVTSER